MVNYLVCDAHVILRDASGCNKSQGSTSVQLLFSALKQGTEKAHISCMDRQFITLKDDVAFVDIVAIFFIQKLFLHRL